MHLRKIDYLNSLRCPKLAWTCRNQVKLAPQAIHGPTGKMMEWRCIEGLARRLFPNGKMVPGADFQKAVLLTQALIGERVPIFEASFESGGCRTKADILAPAEFGTWELIEIKSSTMAKPEHTQDMAYQLHTIRRAGLEVGRCLLAHVNNEYVKQGPIDPELFIEIEDVTDQVNETAGQIANQVPLIASLLEATTCPERKIGPHCVKDGECPMTPVCWRDLPDHNVTELAGALTRALKMLDKWPLIIEVPEDQLNPKQQIQQESLINEKPRVEPGPVKNWLRGLKYPIYNLDFETANPAVPLWDGTRPYQQIPFQFSLAVIRVPGGPTEFVDFLADGEGDPRPALVEKLKVIGPTGTVLAYNATFEKRILNELIEAFPEARHLRSIVDRLDDLATPFREFWLYHPDQHGRYSIKSVLPAWTEYGYNDLTICIGSAASLAFLQIAHKTLSPAMERMKRKALIEYCRRDVMGMVLLLKTLIALSIDGSITLPASCPAKIER